VTELQGKDYCAVRRLSDRDNVTLADVGETCERVPVPSLAPLLASGHIELVVPPPADEATA
jgi:hypothetical protein